MINPDSFQQNAVRITMHYSYGSACFAALINLIIKSLESENKNRSKRNNSIGDVIGDSIFVALREFAEFFTNQAFLYIAFYGKGLFRSGKMAFNSLKMKGFFKYSQMKICDYLLHGMSFVASLTFTMIYEVIIYFILKRCIGSVEDYSFFIVMLIFAGVNFFIGTAVAIQFINNVIGGMSQAQMTLYVEDPERFMGTHEYANKVSDYMEKIKG